MQTTFAQIVNSKVAVNVSNDIVALAEIVNNTDNALAHWDYNTQLSDALLAELTQQFPQLNKTEMQKLFNKCYDTLLD